MSDKKIERISYTQRGEEEESESERLADRQKKKER